MIPALTDLKVWDSLAERDAESIARSIAPPGFTFSRVSRRAHGGQTRVVAFLRHASGLEFALVPGGTRTLGLDPRHPPVLDEAGEASWAQSMADFGFPPLAEYLASVMLPERQVTLPPLLVEVAARTVATVVESYEHEVLLAALAQDGMRLLTSDEWEHACAGGTRSLWRWGNACDGEIEPYGKDAPPELRQPNAFGLAIAQNPYDWEYVMESGRMRGGDGGEALCGGYGAVAAWLACASSYLWPMFDQDSYLDEGFVRRAVPLV